MGDKFVGDPFLLKSHDTAPFLDILEQEQTPGAGDFAPIDLTGCSVRFLMHVSKTFDESLAPDTTIVAAAAAILNPPTDGKVSYRPTGTQTAVPGIYKCEWEVTFPGGIIKTIPEGRLYRKAIVGADLG